MVSVPPNSPTLSGAEKTAAIIKSWLVDENKTRSGMLGVNNALQVVSVRTFPHGLTQSTVRMALDEAIKASATGIVVYGVASERIGPALDTDLIGKLGQACEALNITLVDVMTYSPSVSKGWLSARQQDLI